MDGRSRVASQPTHPGTYFIGRYRVVDDIGVGGMATVHLGRMDGAGGFQKWVAIKRIHPHLVENEQIIKMFLDEARIAASISHPNVAQVFDLGSHEDTHWIAMEYLHGEPLREVLRHVMEVGPALDPPLAARIIADAAEGLHSAHELRGKDGRPLNLVHRDVTPHNLFLTYDGVVKVVDFGIAKVAGRLSTTQAGTLKGKIAYMAPEQIRGKAIDRRTDIFALGVVLWELTTGRRLFRMDTDLETVERVQACVVPPPSSVSYDYPVELESIVMRALQKRPEDRYQTARDLSRALQQYLMQAGQFVGPEELSAYVSDLFGERIKQREAHLKWAADVTKTLSFEQLRPAFVGAGLDVNSMRRDVHGPDSESGSYDEYDDDDDDADETVVEPFRAALMRQEVVRYTSEKPQTGVPRPEAPGSRARVQGLGADAATDASTTRRVVGQEPRPTSEPALATNDLIDDEDDDDIATIVREPAAMLKQDRLIVQRGRQPSARLNPPGAVPATHTPARVVPPSGFVPPPHSLTPSGVVPKAPLPMPSVPPPAMPSGMHPALPTVPHAPGPLNPMPPPGAYPNYDYARSPNAQMYQTVDPAFDETQWARGLRGSPILVYAAAALGGFLIVAVLIAVLLGGPERGPSPPPPPPPTATP